MKNIFVKSKSLEVVGKNDYKLLQYYDVLEIEGTDKLIFPVSTSGDIRYYIPVEESYDVLYDTRIKLGHGGRDRMCHELNSRYKNITLLF